MKRRCKKTMKTQIFGTFGPACATEEILKQMIDEGMTGMRLNLSHAALIESEAYIRAYQRAAVSRGVEPQILIDMQGPELRVGKMEKSVELGEQKRVIIGHNGIPVSKEVLDSENGKAFPPLQRSWARTQLQYPRKFVCTSNSNKLVGIIHVLSERIASITAIYAPPAGLPTERPVIPVTGPNASKYARTFNRQNAKS